MFLTLAGCFGAIGPMSATGTEEHRLDTLPVGAYMAVETGGLTGGGTFGALTMPPPNGFGATAKPYSLTGIPAELSLNLVGGWSHVAIRPELIAGMTIGSNTSLYVGYGGSLMVGVTPRLVLLGTYDWMNINTVGDYNVSFGGSRYGGGLMWYFHTDGTKSFFNTLYTIGSTAYGTWDSEHWSGTRAVFLRVLRTSADAAADTTRSASDLSTWTLMIGLSRVISD